MSTAKNIVAGIGGAVALNILHESLKHYNNDTPRIDLLGEEALQKLLNYCGTEITDEKNLYAATLAGDLVSNAAYYSLVGAAGKKNVWPAAVALGVAAGIGAIVLPSPMGLNPQPVAHNTKAKALTIAYYLTGALVTAGILKYSSKK